MKRLIFILALLMPMSANAVTVSDCSFTNPGADRVFFWDHSNTDCGILTLGSGLSISGTTINTAEAYAPIASPVFTGVVTLPNAASPTTDADGEIAVDIDGWGAGFDAYEVFNGTASAYIVATTASDTPSNGQVPKFNTGGSITWEDDTGSGAPTDADYLVGTSNGSLSAEIVVGTSPGGELGGTWGSPTIDDGLSVSSWNITTPIFTGKINADGGSVNDDDCTGEIGSFWYDDTDSAFEFCNANTGAPTTLGGGGGSPGGANEYVQFNDSGSFGGTQDFLFGKTNQTLQINDSSLAQTNSVTIQPTSIGMSDGSTAFFGVSAAFGLNYAASNANALTIYDLSFNSVFNVDTVNRTSASSIGGSTSSGAIPVVASVNTTAVGNVGGGTDDLITYALPADALSIDGRGVRITAWGTTANNANAKTLVCNFGSTAILTNALTTSVAGVWRIQALVLRTGVDAQDYSSGLTTTGTAGVALNDVEGGTSAQDDGATITIKCTGAATSNNDIVQDGLLVEMLN